MRRAVLLVLLLCVAAHAVAQEPRPERKAPKVAVTIESSPEQAAVYLDDKKYGIVGYTPYAGKLERGSWTLILELPGYKTVSMPIVVGDKHDFSVALDKGGGVVDVQAANDPNVVGATLYVDGDSRGPAPRVADVAEGRHLVELRRPGVGDFQQWVTLKGGERVTLRPILKGAQKGSLLVDADITAATVTVDGKRLADTTPTVVEGLDEGPHVVEVTKGPTQAWKQTVSIKAGQRAKVVAGLAGETPGSLRILANVAEAEIFVDGTNRGRPPLDIAELAPGDHEVTAKAPGYGDASQTVTIEPAKPMAVRLELARGVAGAAGRLRVTAPVRGSFVYVDGTSVGATPLERQVAVGEHVVVVERAGRSRFERKVTVARGGLVVVEAEQSVVGVMRFISVPAGATVLIDGVVAGTTPLAKTDVLVGDRRVTFRADGYRELEKVATVVTGAEAVVLNAVLRPETDLTTEELQVIRRGLSSFGAETVPVARVTLDLAVGYPYWLQVQATTGVAMRPLAFDIQFGFRTTLTTYDLFVSGRLRVARAGPFALAAFAALAGGGGGTGRNQIAFDAGLIGSILFANVATVSARVYAGLWTDRLCDEGNPPAGSDVCRGDASAEDIARARRLHGSDDLTSRDSGVRLMTSIIAEVALSERTSIFVLVEGAPFQDERAAFSHLFTSTLITDSDPIYIGRAGFTFKF